MVQIKPNNVVFNTNDRYLYTVLAKKSPEQFKCSRLDDPNTEPVNVLSNDMILCRTYDEIASDLSFFQSEHPEMFREGFVLSK